MESGITYSCIIDLGILDLYPTRTHNLALENKEFEGTRVRSHDL